MSVGNEKECTRLHAAYTTLRATPTKENYFALLEAFVTELREDTFAFEPVSEEDAEAAKSGTLKHWSVAETPHGRMLAVFTSREQAEKHPAPANIGVKLAAFFRILSSDKNLVGFIVNPSDGKHGVPVERRNAELIARRSGRALPPLNPAIISHACVRLFDIAVGVPTPVYDIAKDIEKIGGHDALLKPILEKHLKARTGTEEPEAFVKAVVRDAMGAAFVAGVLVRKDPALVASANTDECIDGVPNLRDDIVQNTDEYVILLSDNIRGFLEKPTDELVRAVLQTYIGAVAYGAVCFGFGWGIAKFCENGGPEALADLRDRQQAFLKHMNEEAAKAAEKYRQAQEAKAAKDAAAQSPSATDAAAETAERAN